MTIEERAKLAKELFSERLQLQIDKGKSYAGDGDALDNFKRNAKLTGMSKFQVWLIYFLKHIDAIINAIKDNPQMPQDQTEGLKGRIVDAENYLDLLYCLLTEDNQILDLSCKKE